MNVVGGVSGNGVGAVDAARVPAHPPASVTNDSRVRVRRRAMIGKVVIPRRVSASIRNACALSALLAALLPALSLGIGLRLVDDDAMVEVRDPLGHVVYEIGDA